MNAESKQHTIERRKQIEDEITEPLEATGSDFTFNDVRMAIYEEEDNDDTQKIVAMFDNGDPVNLSNVLELVTDAWNYFPHKALGGLSPVEKV